MKLKQKNVLITGATGGFGSCISKSFLREGANILLISKDPVKLENLKCELCEKKSDQQWVNTYALDFSDKSNLPNEFIQQLQQLNGIDILVNNVAIHGPIGASWENDLQLWEKAFNVNFYAALKMCHAIVPLMIKRKSGSIINISGGGATSSRPNFSSYAISKTALVRFTEILAEEVASFGIKVNALSPGAMATNLLKDVLSEEIKAGKKEVSDAKRVFEEGDSMLEAAELCIYLASTESDGLTGKLISAVWDPWDNFAGLKNEIMDSDIYTLRRIVPEERGKNWSK